MADLSCPTCGHKFQKGQERVIDFTEPPDRQYCINCKKPDGLTTMTTTQYREHFQVTDRDAKYKQHYAPMTDQQKEDMREHKRKKVEAIKRESERSWQDRASGFKLTSPSQYQVDSQHGLGKGHAYGRAEKSLPSERNRFGFKTDTRPALTQNDRELAERKIREGREADTNPTPEDIAYYERTGEHPLDRQGKSKWLRRGSWAWWNYPEPMSDQEKEEMGWHGR